MGTFGLPMTSLTFETDVSEPTVLVGFSDIVPPTNIPVSLVEAPPRGSSADTLPLSEHAVEEWGSQLEIIKHKPVVSCEHCSEGFINLDDRLDASVPTVSKDLLHPTLVVCEFSGSMWVNVDDRFRVTIEGCCPGRFGHHRSFRFHLIDDELE